jgi:phage terminase small subunit
MAGKQAVERWTLAVWTHHIKIEKESNMRELTAKQQVFIKEYMIDLNATQAAIRAGYSAKTADRIGPELLGKTCVAEALQEEMAKRLEKAQITADFVLEGIKKSIEACTIAKQYQSALKGYELLGRHLRLFTDNVKQADPIAIKVSFVHPQGAE